MDRLRLAVIASRRFGSIASFFGTMALHIEQMKDWGTSFIIRISSASNASKIWDH